MFQYEKIVWNRAKIPYMSKRERVAIFVDGSNMYHYVKGLGLEPKVQFDYTKFGLWLAGGT